MAMLFPSLSQLYLTDIPTLVELPPSFQNLHKLAFLYIKNCVNLETLPTGINLPRLVELDLSGCSRLRTFPDISTNIEWLHLRKTGIEEVPWWIKRFSRLENLDMNGCNNLEYVNLKIFEHMYGLFVDFSDCKALTEASWSDSPPCVVRSIQRLIYRIRYIHIDFTNCLNLDQEALFQLKTYSICRLKFSGEEVPSYFTHRTTATSSSLTIPLLPSSLSQPFLRFRACIVFNCDNMLDLVAEFEFTGSFWNSSDSYDEAQDFCAATEDYTIIPYSNDGRLFILDCWISPIPLEMNFDHMDMQIHIIDYSDTETDISDSSDNRFEIKEWGIRILEEEEDYSSADNRLGHRNTLPHVFEADGGNTLNEAGQGEEFAGEDEGMEPSCKRMRIS